MHFKQLFCLCFFIVFLSGCDLFKIKEKKDEETEKPLPVARVYDNYLYEEDLEGIVSKDISPKDSAKRVQLYVKNWIKKQLLINEAASKINFNEADIERKILDYKYALMVYEFEKYYVNQQLDKSVQDEEIITYYNENRDNFQLKQNIVKGLYVKVSKDAPKIRRLKKLLRSDKEKDIEELRQYCFSFCDSYSLEDSIWINFDELIKDTPLASIPNKVQFLQDNKFAETSDDNFLYLIRVDDYKISDEISPLQFVRDDIENIIINKRKISLANQLEEEVYERAKQKDVFEIYNN